MIGGFATAGVLISNGAFDTRVLGNRIGFHTEGGVAAGGNDGDGVLVEGSAARTIVGGPGDGMNWIVGVNAGVRVEGTSGTKVVGNVIGLRANDLPPTNPAEKNDVGIHLRKARNAIIGGVLLADHSPENPQERDGNVVSGSTGAGILIESSSYTKVVNNLVGTNSMSQAGRRDRERRRRHPRAELHPHRHRRPQRPVAKPDRRERRPRGADRGESEFRQPGPEQPHRHHRRVPRST